MTTNIFDNKSSTFKFLLSWRFPRKTPFWGDCPLCPRSSHPSKTGNFIFIVVSASLILKGLSCKKRPGSCCRALGSAYEAIGSPYEPSLLLVGALFNSQIVGHSPGFNCIGSLANCLGEYKSWPAQTHTVYKKSVLYSLSLSIYLLSLSLSLSLLSLSLSLLSLYSSLSTPLSLLLSLYSSLSTPLSLLLSLYSSLSAPLSLLLLYSTPTLLYSYSTLLLLYSTPTLLYAYSTLLYSTLLYSTLLYSTLSLSLCSLYSLYFLCFLYSLYQFSLSLSLYSSLSTPLSLLLSLYSSLSTLYSLSQNSPHIGPRHLGRWFLTSLDNFASLVTAFVWYLCVMHAHHIVTTEDSRAECPKPSHS